MARLVFNDILIQAQHLTTAADEAEAEARRARETAGALNIEARAAMEAAERLSRRAANAAADAIEKAKAAGVARQKAEVAARECARLRSMTPEEKQEAAYCEGIAQRRLDAELDPANFRSGPTVIFRR